MSTLVASKIESLGGRVLIPTSGSIIQTVTKRTDARVTYTTGTAAAGSSPVATVLSELDITISPQSVGNQILVEWTISFESSHGIGFYVLVNGSPNNTPYPLTGFSLGPMGYLNNKLGYTIVNYDSSQAGTPQTVSILFSHLVSSINPVTFGLLISGDSFYLNRCVSAANNDDIEQTVSFVNAYEVVGG